MRGQKVVNSVALSSHSQRENTTVGTVGRSFALGKYLGKDSKRTVDGGGGTQN